VAAVMLGVGGLLEATFAFAMISRARRSPAKLPHPHARLLGIRTSRGIRIRVYSLVRRPESQPARARRSGNC
jgi:hypothetical protein